MGCFSRLTLKSAPNKEALYSKITLSSLGGKWELSANARSQAERSENKNKVSSGQQNDQGSTSGIKKSHDSKNEGKETSHRFTLILHGNPFPVMEDEGPFSNFFLDRISKNIREKYPKAHYELEKNSNSQVVAVTWYNINEDLRKEINDALEWTLRKVEENRKAGL